MWAEERVGSTRAPAQQRWKQRRNSSVAHPQRAKVGRAAPLSAAPAVLQHGRGECRRAPRVSRAEGREGMPQQPGSQRTAWRSAAQRACDGAQLRLHLLEHLLGVALQLLPAGGPAARRACRQGSVGSRGVWAHTAALLPRLASAPRLLRCAAAAVCTPGPAQPAARRGAARHVPSPAASTLASSSARHSSQWKAPDVGSSRRTASSDV